MPKDPTGTDINQIGLTRPRGITREGVPIVYNQRSWLKGPNGLDASPRASTNGAALSAITAYAHLIALPTENKTSNYIKGVLTNLEPSIERAWKFYGVGSNNQTITGRIWGLGVLADGPKQEYLGDPLCDLSLVLGAATVTGGSDILPADGRFVDTITITADYTMTPGCLKVGADGADGCPVLVFDSAPGYAHHIIELVAGTATGVGYFHAP